MKWHLVYGRADSPRTGNALKAGVVSPIHEINEKTRRPQIVKEFPTPISLLSSLVCWLGWWCGFLERSRRDSIDSL